MRKNLVMVCLTTFFMSACLPDRVISTSTPTSIRTQTPGTIDITKPSETLQPRDTPKPTDIVQSTTTRIIKTQFPEWETYRSEERGLEIMYPGFISIIEMEKGITLYHAIPLEHNDPCDFKGGGPPLVELVDLEISLEVVEGNLGETVTAKQGTAFASSYLNDNELTLVPDFIDEIAVGSLKGYRILNAVEGCGLLAFYFPLDLKTTLYIKRALITEFLPIVADHHKYFTHPGIIPPPEEEEIFTQILSSFTFIH